MFSWLKSKQEAPKTLGQIGEEFSQAHYETVGFRIIAKNEFNKKGKRLGEIDFIAVDKEHIIFVEVKTRTNQGGRFGSGAEAVNIFKQQKLLKAAHSYLLRHPNYANLKPQIDVCVVDASDLRQLELVQSSPAKYRLNCQLDKLPFFVTIIVNAVEDLP